MNYGARHIECKAARKCIIDQETTGGTGKYGKSR